MGKPVLLIVDNNPDLLKQIQRDLERRYGRRYRVITASSGEEALATLHQLRKDRQRVAVVLADHKLRDMDGVELLKKARAIFEDAKCVLLTAFDESEQIIQTLKEFRIDDYLVKPCRPPDHKLYPVFDDLIADWESRPDIENLRVIGSRFSPEAHQVRDFLARNCVPFEWLEVDRDGEARRLLGDSEAKPSGLPVVIFPDGTKLTQPTNAEIAKRIGLKVRPEGDFYDLVIVGGGPSGLAASVYGASEGLRTVMVERDAPGGQAGLSSMIENYLGFPAGLSGADLARRAVAQAKKFEVEIISPQIVTSLRVEGSTPIVTLSDGTQLRSHVALLATGVQWRRLDVPGIDRLVGAGVYYGGTLAEAFFCRNEDIYLVGGANSAGQAAVYFSRYARTVTMLVRGETLDESMSRYLIDQIKNTPKIKVRPRTTVVEVRGEDRLEAITIFDAEKNQKETLPTNALFIFIGALPHTDWLENVVRRDDHGFILTGPDLSQVDGNGHFPKEWQLNRDPYWLESSQPGIFVAGDVRHGSVKRVAAGVGEGATAVQFIHQYLGSVER
ncbi:MAG TPA: FAD-dependent oxidoreductase [Candidatus Binatia bacterium]|nr:FAD-dependent oxidoreductase [Candidatus Binatia bacterium]